MYKDPQVSCTSSLCAFEIKDLKIFSFNSVKTEPRDNTACVYGCDEYEGNRIEGVSRFKGVANKQSLA